MPLTEKNNLSSCLFILFACFHRNEIFVAPSGVQKERIKVRNNIFKKITTFCRNLLKNYDLLSAVSTFWFHFPRNNIY